MRSRVRIRRDAKSSRYLCYVCMYCKIESHPFLFLFPAMESKAMMQTISFSPQPWRSPLPCSSSSSSRKTSTPSSSHLPPLLCRRSPTSPSSAASLLSPSLHLLLSGCKLPSSSSSIDYSPEKENQHAKKHFFLEINAIAKKQKPPLKPASRNAIIASIVVPLLLAGGAAITGKVLLRKLEAESLAEV